MFGGYTALPQRDSSGSRTPGLFVDSHSLSPRRGLSCDYIPDVSHNNFSDASQGWLSWICNLVVISLVYLLTFMAFPITGWFVLKTVPNYQRIVVFRLGRICPPKGPGVVLVLPLIDQWQKVDLRTRAFNIPPCQVSTQDGGMLLVGADIQFRIWNPVLSVVSVQDLNASTRMTAHNALTHSLAKKSVREIQSERLKLGEYLGMDINEMTQPWGLEVDRVELTIGSVLKAPEENHPGSASLIMPPSVPGLEGITGPIQQLAMHFLNRGGDLHPSPGDSITFTDELSGAPQLTSGPDSVEDLLATVKPVLSEALVSRVGATFQFHIGSADGQQRSYYLDLSQGSGAAGAGSLVRDPDVTLSMSDSDLLSMFRGELSPFAAYTGGRLQLQGDVSAAMKLEELINLLKKQ